MTSLRTLLLAGASLGLAAVVIPAAVNAAAAPTPSTYAASTEWPTYGHDSGGMRFSPVKQITPANVANLQTAWVYHMRPADYAPAGGGRGGAGAPAAAGGAGRGGAPAGGRAGAPADLSAAQAAAEGAAPAAPTNAFAAAAGGRGAAGPGYSQSEVTPLVIGGIMYLATPYGTVVALDPTTGKEVWVYKLPSGNPPTRGVEYFAGDATTPPQIIVAASNNTLFTLDARTGALNTRFGTNGVVPIQNAPSSPPSMFQNLIIIGSRAPENSGPGPAGDVKAYDVHDGRLVWTFHSIPQPGEPNYGGWVGNSANQRSGVNVWGLITVDEKRGIAYLPFGAPSGDQFGGDRPGDNLYGSSLVAVDAKTGKYLWHFQVVHHDIFDGDLEAPPLLMDVKQGGKTIPAVAVINKNSILFLLDRVTGKPIYDVEERPVTQTKNPAEKTSPTQPVSVKPGPLARNTFQMSDIATVTPELEASCRKLITDNNLLMQDGPLPAPGFNQVQIMFPSWIGGPNWGGSSFSPDLGYLFVNVSDMGQMVGTRNPATGAPDPASLVGTNQQGGRTGPFSGLQPSGRFKDNTLNMLCNQPPWGEMVAVNVNTGNVAWRVPLGVTDSLPADKQKTGRPGMGGSIVTAGGVVFVGATDDNRFRALDAKTGKELWSAKLDASAGSVPSTYLGKDGKQYVVVASAGNSFLGAPITSDAITAFRLK